MNMKCTHMVSGEVGLSDQDRRLFERFMQVGLREAASSCGMTLNEELDLEEQIALVVSRQFGYKRASDRHQVAARELYQHHATSALEAVRIMRHTRGATKRS